MSEYVRGFLHSTVFDGDAVTVAMKPLEYGDFRELMNSVGKDSGVGSTELYQRVLPKYITSLTGLRAKDGGDVSVDELLRMAYFVPMVAELLGRLMKEALPKNLKPSSGTLTEASKA